MTKPIPTSKRWRTLGVVSALLMLCGCGSGTPKPAATVTVTAKPSPSPSPSVVNALGSVTVLGDYYEDDAGDCNPTQQGYGDITKDAQVVIADSTGKVIALGAISAPATVNDAQSGCSFPFFVHDVPVGEKIYNVEVTHRGRVPIKAEDLGQIELTLGS